MLYIFIQALREKHWFDFYLTSVNYPGGQLSFRIYANIGNLDAFHLQTRSGEHVYETFLANILTGKYIIPYYLIKFEMQFKPNLI